MKNYTRLSNAITETPTRPGSEDNVSERQQGESKRIKQGNNSNYYTVFSAMFKQDKPEDKEEGIGTVDGPFKTSSSPNETTSRRAEKSTMSGKKEESSTRKMGPTKITEKTSPPVTMVTPKSNKKGSTKEDLMVEEKEDEAKFRLPKTSLRKKSTGEHNIKAAETPKKTATFAAVVRNKDKEPVQRVDLNVVIVSFNIRIQKGVADVKKEFQKLIGLALSTIKENLDGQVCILPLEGPITTSTARIKSTQDMPKLIMGQKKFFYIPNPTAFNSVQQNGRMIKGSARMGFITDPISSLAQAGADLRALNCGLYYKELQEVYTVSETVLLGAPMVMSEEDVKIIVIKELKLVEHGENQPADWQLDFEISKTYAPGMPWETEEEKKKNQGTGGSKQTYLFHVSKKHANRLELLLKKAKEKKVWRKYWGNTAFTVMVPSFSASTEEKTKYHQMVNAHGAIQLSLGHAELPGIVDLETKYSLDRLPDKDSNPTNPSTLSVRDILTLMTIGEDSKGVWTSLVVSGQGTVHGYFSSTDQEIRDHIPKIQNCIAAQAYFWLIKRGCKATGIKRMFKKCFTVEQIQKISKSKYANGVARVKDEEDGDNIISEAIRAGIDLNLGLTATQLKEQRKDKEYDAAAISYGQAMPGAFEGHDFSEELSLTTLNTKKTRNDEASLATNTMAHSRFSIGSTVGAPNDSDDDSDLEADGHSNGVTLEGMEMLRTLRVQAESSDQSSKDSRTSKESSTGLASQNESKSDKSTESMKEIARKLRSQMKSGTPPDEEEEEWSDARCDDGGTVEFENNAKEKILSLDDGGENSSMEDGEYNPEDASDSSDESMMHDGTQMNEEGGLSLDYEIEDILDDNEQEEEWNKHLFSNYRMITQPASFQDVLWNEAGPTPTKMLAKLNSIQNELQKQVRGEDREEKSCSTTLMRHLCDDAKSTDLQDLIQHVTMAENYMEQLCTQEALDKLTARNMLDNTDWIAKTDEATIKTKQDEEEKQHAYKTRGTPNNTKVTEGDNSIIGGTESMAKDG